MSKVKEGAQAAGRSASSVAKSFGISSSDAAKYLGTWGVGAVKLLGVRRALFGTALVGAVGGGVIAARYLLRRRQARRDKESMKASDAAGKRHASTN